MPQLVEQDRGEERHGARDGQRVRPDGAVGRMQDRAVEARQPEDDQEEDEEPRVVDPDPDAADSKERYRPTCRHEAILGSGSGHEWRAAAFRCGYPGPPHAWRRPAIDRSLGAPRRGLAAGPGRDAVLDPPPDRLSGRAPRRRMAAREAARPRCPWRDRAGQGTW